MHCKTNVDEYVTIADQYGSVIIVIYVFMSFANVYMCALSLVRETEKDQDKITTKNNISITIKIKLCLSNLIGSHICYYSPAAIYLDINVHLVNSKIFFKLCSHKFRTKLIRSCSESKTILIQLKCLDYMLLFALYHSVPFTLVLEINYYATCQFYILHIFTYFKQHGYV